MKKTAFIFTNPLFLCYTASKDKKGSCYHAYKRLRKSAFIPVRQ